MAELWQNFMNWYTSIHLDEVFDWLFRVAIPMIIVFLAKARNTSVVKEIKAVSENKEISNAFKEVFNGLSERLNKLESINAKSNANNDKVMVILALLIKEAKVSSDVKEKAINIIKQTEEVVVPVVEKTEVKLVEVIEDVEKSIVEEKNAAPEPTILDDLVNSFKS